jgi:hypothetical protein
MIAEDSKRLEGTDRNNSSHLSIGPTPTTPATIKTTLKMRKRRNKTPCSMARMLRSSSINQEGVKSKDSYQIYNKPVVERREKASS